MAQNLGVIVVTFEGAGSGLEGFENRCKARKNIGFEISDFVDVLGDIKTKHKTLDLSSTGLLGEQYGHKDFKNVTF